MTQLNVVTDGLEHIESAATLYPRDNRYYFRVQGRVLTGGIFNGKIYDDIANMRIDPKKKERLTGFVGFVPYGVPLIDRIEAQPIIYPNDNTVEFLRKEGSSHVQGQLVWGLDFKHPYTILFKEVDFKGIPLNIRVTVTVILTNPLTAFELKGQALTRFAKHLRSGVARWASTEPIKNIIDPEGAEADGIDEDTRSSAIARMEMALLSYKAKDPNNPESEALFSSADLSGYEIESLTFEDFIPTDEAKKIIAQRIKQEEASTAVEIATKETEAAEIRARGDAAKTREELKAKADGAKALAIATGEGERMRLQETAKGLKALSEVPGAMELEMAKVIGGAVAGHNGALVSNSLFPQRGSHEPINTPVIIDSGSNKTTTPENDPGEGPKDTDKKTK